MIRIDGLYVSECAKYAKWIGIFVSIARWASRRMLFYLYVDKSSFWIEIRAAMIHYFVRVHIHRWYNPFYFMVHPSIFNFICWRKNHLISFVFRANFIRKELLNSTYESEKTAQTFIHFSSNCHQCRTLFAEKIVRENPHNYSGVWYERTVCLSL